MTKKKKQSESDSNNPGNLVIHIKDIDSNENLSNVKVGLGKKKAAKQTDDTGVVIFSKVPSGRLSLCIEHPDFEFDHMQFHGKSHTESIVTLQPGEHLDVLIYLKGQMSTAGLDELVSGSQADPDDCPPTVDVGESASIAAAMHSLQQMQQEMQDVLEQPAQLSQKISEMESNIVFKNHKDPKEMAIKIQEHLGLPKFVEEHPMAPVMWEKCLQISEALHPVVSERDEMLKTVKDNVQRLQDYAEFIKGQDFIEESLKHVKNCETGKAVEHLTKAASHLKTMKKIVSSTKQKLLTLNEVSSRIDYPDKIKRIGQIVRKEVC